MTDGQGKAASIDVESERGALVQRVEIVRCICGHCQAETGTRDGRLLRMYDAGARITIKCHACHENNVCMMSRVIKARSVPPPPALIAMK